MATEKRMIYAHDLWSDIMMLPHNGDIISSEEVEQAIMDAPTVDAVEVVHGRWAALDDDCEEVEDQEEAMRWGCSACCEIVEYDDWTHRSRLTRYCPNCGAKMDGGSNETD